MPAKRSAVSLLCSSRWELVRVFDVCRGASVPGGEPESHGSLAVLQLRPLHLSFNCLPSFSCLSISLITVGKSGANGVTCELSAFATFTRSSSSAASETPSRARNRPLIVRKRKCREGYLLPEAELNFCHIFPVCRQPLSASASQLQPFDWCVVVLGALHWKTEATSVFRTGVLLVVDI